MYNWSTDEKKLQKHTEQYARWKLEQQINFGLNGEKIHERDLRAYLPKIEVDPARKKFLTLLLYEFPYTK
jgi:hypothetical protein